MEWTVKELAERAGISGAALRHYHRIGLLHPDRVGSNGYRYYGPTSVARLQRLLLLRETGMALTEIAAVLDAPETPLAEREALQTHLEQLNADKATLERRIAAVQHTLAMRQEGREPRMDVMLQGFNDAYEAEVVERWGRDAFDASHQWWHGKSVREQRAWKADTEALLARWRELQEAGHEPDSAAARTQATAHLDWFAQIPGTPTHAGDTERSTAMVLGIADQYESNPDFHVSFGSEEAARFAAEVLRTHVRRLP
ncbi:MerR family transcriptional regulator [Pseudoclavibacter sp. RFBJ3]|uniref:MerR family transcriptional regulator n=1 Tax=unclassified Pseudoclavibacter TaxID=2615177 RepID=UPI000CE7303F|nr:MULTISPECIES: MerR family transcriptional regulator [unclassified Pseudoclavibacter]PPF84438.1 MerR family transcriptional regulator [Pseudoclavibacter sp. RFBJ5]PPF92661.1 MerR family transcriptional regulator [Pseudoclavibacter sp. RFBJ3]PPF98266.1 MerR family transcriptional regulator [Pseudoclavibacter sp. RFBH5]PPG25336.1 MerR family transcriptional regulator [Pseudoclavibacter sp. RFBI4]